MNSKAIIYIENSISMHQEWFTQLEDQLLDQDVKTVHCIGLEEARYSEEPFELLSLNALKEACAGSEVVLVVCDVYMDNPLEGDTLGGLTVVKALKKILRDDMPPVLIASTRPERRFTNRLHSNGISVIGSVKIDSNNVKNESHWSKIYSNCLQQAGIERIQIEVTLLGGDWKTIKGIDLYSEVLIKIPDQSHHVRLQAFSAPALVFQLMARTPGREWSLEELSDFLESGKSVLRKEESWQDLLSQDNWKTLLGGRVRSALTSFKTTLPQVIYPRLRGTYVCLASVTWVGDER